MELIYLWVCVCVCVILWLYQQWIGWELCVLWVWKGIGSDYRKSWHQINSNPHKREDKWKKKERGELQLKETAALMFIWEEGRVKYTVGFWLCNNCWVMLLFASKVAVCSTFKQLFISTLWYPCVLYKNKNQKWISLYDQPLFYGRDVLLFWNEGHICHKLCRCHKDGSTPSLSPPPVVTVSSLPLGFIEN